MARWETALRDGTSGEMTSDLVNGTRLLVRCIAKTDGTRVLTVRRYHPAPA